MKYQNKIKPKKEKDSKKKLRRKKSVPRAHRHIPHRKHFFSLGKNRRTTYLRRPNMVDKILDERDAQNIEDIDPHSKKKKKKYKIKVRRRY